MTSPNQLNSFLDHSDYYGSKSIINFSDYKLTPIISLSNKSDIERNHEISIPILKEKIIQWFFNWQGSEPISSLFLKLGTGNRINHCRLELSLWQAQTKITTASLDGTLVTDNEWTEFSLEKPIKPGQFLAQLQSPDADNYLNTLFIWLTEARPEVLIVDEVFEPYYYGLLPIFSLSAEQICYRKIETIISIFKEKILQWPFEWEGHQTISSLFLKLGTGGRVNHCQLVLSILIEQADHKTTLLTKASINGSLVEDAKWTEFRFETPLKPGKYLCQLRSPDTDNANNVLFVWLTMAKPELARLNFIDLDYYGLTPVVKYFPQQKDFQPVKTLLPLLRNQVIQWSLKLENEKFPLNLKSSLFSQKTEITAESALLDDKEEFHKISTIYLKLGTGGRNNQCRLILSILQVQPHQQTQVVATASQEGLSIRDNQWTPFTLDHPIKSGHYLCQLESPDTDDTHNVLFIGLAVAKPAIAHYCYRETNKIFQNLFWLEQLFFSKRKWRKLAKKTFTPLISIIVPIFGTNNPPHLRDCLHSIVKQTYPNWELCIASQVFDSNTTFIDEFQAKSPFPIKRVSGQLNQTMATLLNQALEVIKGQYTILLYPDDLLTQDALAEVAKYIQQAPTTLDMLYSDEDKVNENGWFEEPYFKPDWSPNLIYGIEYTGQLSVYRTQLVQEIGGFREQIYAQARWDMVLRLTEKASQILHIPSILYHHRKQQQVPTNQNLILKIVQEALNRKKQDGYVTLNPRLKNTCLVHYPVQGQPLVSIIIPTKDRAPILAQCINSIIKITTYSHWEIIVVDNGSTEAETLALFEHYQAELGEAFTVCRHDSPFNFAKLVNEGVKVAQGDIILLLNNDIELLSPSDWLQEMIGFAQHPEIAAVGCKLLYPQDNTLQHAGLICGIGGIANPGHKHFPADSVGYFKRLAVVANYSAITGACLMIQRVLWEQVNGFDENLKIAFNDVDFCLKLLQNGFRHVVLPHVTFYHYESKSRGLENTTIKKKRLKQETAYMKKRWGTLLQNDPFYNPNLTQKVEDFRLATNSRYYCKNYFK